MFRLIVAVLAGMCSVQGPAEAFDQDAEAAEERADQRFDLSAPFKPSIDAMTDVEALMARAQANGKLALIVMGANWCHDSLGLVKHFTDPSVAAVLAKNYEVGLVDVGYLDHSLSVATRFGLPVIYGTPTVLIVEPKTGTLLNGPTSYVWRDSASMTAEEVAERLGNQQHNLPAVADATGELARLYNEIRSFEAKQAARVYGGFAIVGPMLGADDRPATFNSYWSQLRDLRYSLPTDLQRLREEARKRVAAGETGITLQYPDYPAFAWEK